MSRTFRNTPILTVALVIAILIFVSSVGGTVNFALNVGSLGYSSAFEGPKAKFAGVNYDGQKLTSALPGGEYRADTVLKFDPDDRTSGKPNLVGEMTTVFLPETSGLTSTWLLSYLPGTEAQSWIQKLSYIKNPQTEKPYSWNISDKTYQMYQYLMKWYVSFTAEWDGSEGGKAETPGEIDRNYLSRTEAWLEFDVTPTWYIEGGGTAYFAIAKIQLSDVARHGKQSGEFAEPDSRMSVSPESPFAALYIYQDLWGQTRGEKTVQTYQGKNLNPDYFGNKVYAHIDFNNFGVTTWNEYFTVKSRGDIITMGFDVTVFVIGEWQVQDVQNIADVSTWFERSQKEFIPSSLLDYLADPRVQALLGLAVTAGIVIVLLIVAPWVLIAFASLFSSLFSSGRRRK